MSAVLNLMALNRGGSACWNANYSIPCIPVLSTNPSPSVASFVSPAKAHFPTFHNGLSMLILQLNPTWHATEDLSGTRYDARVTRFGLIDMARLCQTNDCLRSSGRLITVTYFWM